VGVAGYNRSYATRALRKEVKGLTLRKRGLKETESTLRKRREKGKRRRHAGGGEGGSGHRLRGSRRSLRPVPPELGGWDLFAEQGSAREGSRALLTYSVKTLPRSAHNFKVRLPPPA